MQKILYALAGAPDRSHFSLKKSRYCTYYNHLVTGVSVIKEVSLYVFAIWGRDLVSVLRIGKYVRILSGHRKLSVIERCPLGEVRLYLLII